LTDSSSVLIFKLPKDQQTNGVKMENKKETFEVELFIHMATYGEEYYVAANNMAELGYPYLGSQTVTLNIPTKNPIEAEIEMLDKKEAVLVEEHSKKIHAIQQRKKDLQCLEFKDE